MSQSQVNEVVNILSEQILVELAGTAQRQWYPTHDADADDDRMKAGKERAAELRKIREQYENLMTGVIL